jgi:hypothetical protein
LEAFSASEREPHLNFPSCGRNRQQHWFRFL